jgi:hypothetical protein
VVLLLGVIATAVLALRQATGDAAAPAAAAQRVDPTAAAARSRPVGLRAGRVTVSSEGFLSSALLDRRTGRISGSANLAAPGDTMSMVKAWLAADFLRGVDERGEEPTDGRLRQLSIMIRDSDNAAAQATYQRVRGRESIERLIETCRLTDSRAAGRRWTPWLLDEMRQVRGAGDFGVRTALPDEDAAAVAVFGYGSGLCRDVGAQVLDLPNRVAATSADG